MLKKIIQIKNYGTFENYNCDGDFWDGKLLKNNIIYAPNGSGKTSISLIFQSLMNNNNDTIFKKKNLNVEGMPEIRLLSENEVGAESFVKFDENGWNGKLSDIEVFNSFYFSDHVYTFNFHNEESFNDRLSNASKEKLDKIKSLNSKRIKKSSQLKNINNLFNRIKKGNIQVSSQKFKKSVIFKRKLEAQLTTIKNESERLYADVIKEFPQMVDEYYNLVNRYLEQFTDHIKINNIKYTTFKLFQTNNSPYGLKHLVFTLTINGTEMNIDARNKISFEYILSDGDKNAIALASFLAKIDFQEDTSKKIVVIDDPFTSFDTFRKYKTINLIGKLSKKISQLIVLTHDLQFANDVRKRIYDPSNTLSLQLMRYQNDVIIKQKDFSEELLIDFVKEMKILDTFLENGADNQFKIKMVKDSIRLALEGIFRIKFYKYNTDNVWLGDFLKLIDESSTVKYPEFVRLKQYLPDLRGLNDYSSPAHHDVGGMIGHIQIDSAELRTYVKETISLIEKI